MMRKFSYIKQITCDPGHYLSDLCVVKIVIRQLLQVRKSILPHIRFDSRPHNMARISHVKAGHAVNNPQHKINHANCYNRPHSKRRQIIHPDIGNIAKYQRQNQFAYCRERSAE